MKKQFCFCFIDLFLKTCFEQKNKTLFLNVFFEKLLKKNEKMLKTKNYIKFATAL